MNAVHMARAWAVTRKDGVTLGFTDHDQDLNFDQVRFRPDSGLSARAVAQGLGLSIDNTEAAGLLSDDAITETDLLAGRWDGAEICLWEVDWTAPESRRLIFRGSMGEVARNGAAFRAELRGLSEPLGRVQGRVYHPLCSAQLGDGHCGFDISRAGYQAEGILLSQDGGILRLAGIPAYDARWFERGVIEVLTGPAAGLTGQIKNDDIPALDRREIEIWTAFGIQPEAGDRMRLLAGCDKRAETCRLKFLNFLNFRGFPHLPSEDWLMAPQVGR